ncbi:ABC-2 transporter permease [Aminipila sp.]|uniref:ABC-2 transporter permease n=1 Tax=Aminipila sp. TaxID=2060095 RepID=UPI00289EFB62|nr:ABC-2 transporter permease [Aminipila sp.]
MRGLLWKDYYLITKNLQPIILLSLFPPIFVAMQNAALLMPILSIIIPLLFASQLSTTMGHDESAKWRKNITAMPVSPLVEAGSKYILLLFLSLISIIIFSGIGLIAYSLNLVPFQVILLYLVLSLFYSLFYGLIIIPASYKYGTSNSKYFFMLFVFIPTFLPVIFNMLNIKVDLTKMLSVSPVVLALIILFIVLLSCVISLYLSIKVLKHKK